MNLKQAELEKDLFVEKLRQQTEKLEMEQVRLSIIEEVQLSASLGGSRCLFQTKLWMILMSWVT